MKNPPVSILNAVTRWLFILCLPVMLLTAGIAVAVNCSWLYQYGFEKYDVGSTTGLEKDQLNKAADGLIGFFNSDEEVISLTVIKDGQSFKNKTTKLYISLSYCLIFLFISAIWLCCDNIVVFITSQHRPHSCKARLGGWLIGKWSSCVGRRHR